MLGAGRDCGHSSGAITGICARDHLPGLPGSTAWAGSRLLRPHLSFLVKNSLEVRQRGAEVFAISVSTLLSMVMPWQGSRKVKRM